MKYFHRSQLVSTPNAAGSDACVGASKVTRQLIVIPGIVLALLAILARSGMASSGTEGSAGPWPTYNNGYDGRRFSPAAQITAANVNTLKRVCETNLGDSGTFHSGPIVINDALYVTTAHSTVALNSSSCEIKWRHVYKPAQQEVYAVNRGVAYLDGRLFRGTGDGRVFALDANTGKQLWVVKKGDPTNGDFFSSAPIA